MLLKLLISFLSVLNWVSYCYVSRGSLGRSISARFRQLTAVSDKDIDKLSDPTPTSTDVVVIGAGLAGLSCAAMLSAAGIKVTVLESHDTAGGCAHTWQRLGYHFESGPSLYSGFSVDKSPNPLKNIFQIIGEEPEWITYDRWGTALPEGKFAAKIGPEEFTGVLTKYGGPGAVEDWNRLIEKVVGAEGLSVAAQATPSLALREDLSVVFTLAKYWQRTLTTLKMGADLNKSFATIRDELQLTNRFVLNWLDMLCFLLQGLPADGTMNAVIAYMLADWYRPGVALDYPKGGSGAIVQALIRGIRKNGGRVVLNKHVTEVMVENNKAKGVILRDTRTKTEDTVLAKMAVVSNIDAWNTRKLIPEGANGELDALLKKMADTPRLSSFIHLHAGIDAADLPTTPSADFPAQWAVIKDWDVAGGVEAPRNVVLVSVPSLLDPSLAPPGKHVIHAYTPATEPYEWWSGLDRKSEEYHTKKEEAGAFLWDAVEQYIPNARQKSDQRVEQIGTPLTHERFLRRSFGTYGSRIKAGEQSLPGHKTPLKNFYMVGDFTFPGIGVPAAASSGSIAATTIMSVGKHLELLDRMKLPDFP